MIEVAEYQKDYFDILTAMHESQSATTTFLDQETLPKIGYIASDSATHVAIGFLRMIEGGFGQIDTLVTNADLPGETRHLGVTAVVDKLIEVAKHLKLKGIISLTVDNGVLSRAEAIGFKVVPETVIVLPL